MNAAASEPGNDADRGNQRQHDDCGGSRHEFVELAAPWRLTQRDDRQDPPVHEFGMPQVKLLARMPCQGLKLKIEELANIERAGFIGFVEVAIARIVNLPIKYFLFDQELGPFEIAVSGKEGIVQIEQGEAHGGVRSTRDGT